ncbi:MAG: hypothetical protein ACRDKG_06175 [Actinomycetota bacterium]
MGPMTVGKRLDRRRVVKLSALGMIALFTWSFIAAPPSVSQSGEPAAEPEEIIAYSTFAEAAPVSSYLDHKSPVPAPAFGVALAHSLTEVNQPSQASALAWLSDFGIANGLHGTTTGAAVPTEASARQPGGAAGAEFETAGGPVGEEEFGRVAAGVARASATQVGSPRGFANSYLGNLVLFPAAGTPPEPPGTYDPGDTFPGGDQLSSTPDPGPRNQMAILSVGSIASTSESIRNGETVTSIGVAELGGINIGNRTSDNRCTNCFSIDAIRVETFAQTNGNDSRAAYRVMLGRACRRALVVSGEPASAYPREEDTCLPLQEAGEGDPNAPETGGLHAIDTSQFNDFFSEPLILSGLTCPGSSLPCTIALRITAGQIGHADPRRPERTVNPPDSACRNYAYPDPDPKAKPIADCQELPESIRPKTGPDQDDGQEAKAVAEGIDLEILTLTGTQLVPENADLDTCFGVFDGVNGVLGQLPLDQAPAPPAPLPDLASALGTVSQCPIGGLRQIREVNLTLGVAQAAAIARPNIPVEVPSDGGGGPIGGLPIGGPVGGGPIIDTPVDGGSGSPVTVVGGGLAAGKYALKIDWGSFRIRPWKAGDMAKAILAGGMFGTMVWLIRRRLRFGAG